MNHHARASPRAEAGTICGFHEYCVVRHAVWLRAMNPGTVFFVERGDSAVKCRTRNQVSPGSNPPLLPFRRLGIFVLSIDVPVDSAV